MPKQGVEVARELSLKNSNGAITRKRILKQIYSEAKKPGIRNCKLNIPEEGIVTFLRREEGFNVIHAGKTSYLISW